MIRCRTCCMPNTRPDTAWIDGRCTACISYERRPTIDWEARKKELIQLLDRHQGICMVPSSGGKDSTYQVMTLLELGADVTVVTATTCHLTPIGRANIDNLSRHARTIEYSPNKKVRAKLNRLGLELVGDISWPEHAAIFSIPFLMSQDLGIPLMFFGENSQDQYGGPIGSADAKQLTQRWRSEFGGFLGLRPDDFVGMEGITDDDMDDYRFPFKSDAEAHFLGQYIPWDSHENARVAMAAGMRAELPSPANWWTWENQDNAQTGIHDHFMFRKFGFGRGCQQVSVDVRSGRKTRESGMYFVDHFDGAFPDTYAGVPLSEILDRIDMKPSQFAELLDKFTNKELT